MDILIPDSWLKDYLKTNAKIQDISHLLSLSGPSVERVSKKGNDFVYSVEITTNRVDAASIYGIAREAASILPRFGFAATLLKPKTKANQPLSKKVGYIKATVDHSLCQRFTCILIKNVQIRQSFQKIQQRLLKVGGRPINNIVDITNYVMHGLGQPMHTFDYDKIKGAKLILRESRKGERITTLDGQTVILPGGDIVIEDGEKRIIDLAGIMGGQNSAIDQNTKNILLFVQTYNPVKIRQTSMKLAKRSEAASLFEKGLDPENVEVALRFAIDLLQKEAGGKPEEKILDLYKNPYQGKTVGVGYDFILDRLGVKIIKDEIIKILKSLGFQILMKKNDFHIGIPSWRAADIESPEDIVEEVARIYGYYNIPSVLPSGKLPESTYHGPFTFEKKTKQILMALGGIEIYTVSFVSEEQEKDKSALKLKNPLGTGYEVLRTSLKSSLLRAADQNPGEKNPFHIFEMSNIYLPRNADLPEERMNLAGIFCNFEYRDAKGALETLFETLGENVLWKPKRDKNYQNANFLEIILNGDLVGKLEILENRERIYYELDMQKLEKGNKGYKKYKPIPKYPAQIEDITITAPAGVYLQDVICQVMETDKRIAEVALVNTYKNTKTLRITYQDPDRTLTDKEVGKIREKMIKKIKSRFGITIEE